MGLWTVKHILTRHKGKVDIQSSHGKGTRVELWWPRVYSANTNPMTRSGS